MKIAITVTSKNRSHRFVALVHLASSLNQFHLDPLDFYLKYGNSIPPDNHHELELLELPTEMEHYPLHIHKSRFTGKPFVCYPQSIPSIERAKVVFTVWCVGSVSTAFEGIDLNSVYSKECKDNAAEFFQLMKSRYGIAITEITTSD